MYIIIIILLKVFIKIDLLLISTCIFLIDINDELTEFYKYYEYNLLKDLISIVVILEKNCYNKIDYILFFFNLKIIIFKVILNILNII